MNKELKEGIEVSKNLLDTLPKNNIKNKNKYKEVLEDTKNNYENILNLLLKEIEKRYNKYININESIDINNEELTNIKNNLYLLNPYNTSYEKLNLDKILYKLNHFYKADLNNANDNILECINIFEKVGINIKSDDFNFSEYSNKYMNVLLNDSENIKECFEDIYWQCPELFNHIELNIKHLYYKNEKVFDKYINSLKDKFLKQYPDALNTYKDLLIKFDYNKSTSLNRGLNKFIDNIWNINDYQEIKIDKYYQFFTNDKEDIETINDEIYKLSRSIDEYKNYLYFEYIINDLKDKYKNKKDQKSNLKKQIKTIKKLEKTIIKLNKKRKNISKLSDLIKELDGKYDELDIIKFNDKIYRYTNETSSINDLLSIACSNYLYIVNCIKESNNNRDFDKEQESLMEFILSPYNTIIMNILPNDEKDISLIISDRYKLSNFNLIKDNLTQEEYLDEIINNAKKIDIYNKIVLKISYENINFIIKAKDILGK